MVFLALKESLFTPSCWSLLVMNGGRGLLSLKLIQYRESGLFVVYLQLFAVPFRETRAEALELGDNAPVLARNEFSYLPFPVADEPHGDRLHPSGRKPVA